MEDAEFLSVVNDLFRFPMMCENIGHICYFDLREDLPYGTSAIGYSDLIAKRLFDLKFLYMTDWSTERVFQYKPNIKLLWRYFRLQKKFPYTETRVL
jgi:hypothetical protein